MSQQPDGASLLQHFGGMGDNYSLDGLKLHYSKQPTLGGEKHIIHARLPDRGAPIGSLSWVGKDGSREYKPGEITWVQVGRGYDGKGVARKMLEHAQQLHDAGHVDTLPMHSDDLTRDGRGFVNSVSDGSDVYEPHNWENHDHGYEDATKARPRLRKKDMEAISHVLDTWQPTDRLFAPTNGSLDPRLFATPDRIRPEVRDYAMGRLAAWWDGRYADWRTWSKVYIAGSSISEWWADKDAIQAHAADREVDPKYRLNDDLDTLIGVEYKGLVEANPQFAGMSPKMVSAHLNAELREHCNLEGVYLNVPASEVPEWEWAGDPEDGKVRVGPWSSTFYVNPNSYDIRAIKPYAAYNLSDDEWAVRPVSEPTGHKFSPTEWYYFEGVAQQVKGALALPEPARTNRSKRIWEHIHSSRSGAFGPHGQGVFDYRNAVEKYLDQAGLWQQLVDARFPGQKTGQIVNTLRPEMQHNTSGDISRKPSITLCNEHHRVLRGLQTRYNNTDGMDPNGWAFSLHNEGVKDGTCDECMKNAVDDIFNKTAAQDHEVTYHLTDNPHFALNPDHQPEDNALSIRPREHKGLYTAERPSDWTGTQGYVRPYVAEIHSPKGIATDERWGGEKFIPAEHFDKVKVHRVIPLDAHEREAFGEHGRIETHHGSEFDSGKPIARDGWDQPPRHHFGEGYHYDGPDVRDMTPEQHTQHYNRWKGYMTGDRGLGHNEFDDAKQTLAEPKDEDFDEEGMFIKRDQHGQKISSKFDPTTLHPNMNHYRDSGMGGVGEDRSVIGYVSTDALRKMHGNETERSGVEHYRESLRNGEGFKDPAMVIFDPKTHRAYLGEGNHRVQAAHEEGVSHVPVRVVRGSVSNPAAQNMEHASTPYKGNLGEDYWPSDIHPSHIFASDEVLSEGKEDPPSRSPRLARLRIREGRNV